MFIFKILDINTMEEDKFVWFQYLRNGPEGANELWFRPVYSSEFKIVYLLIEQGEGYSNYPQNGRIIILLKLCNHFYPDFLSDD